MIIVKRRNVFIIYSLIDYVNAGFLFLQGIRNECLASCNGKYRNDYRPVDKYYNELIELCNQHCQINQIDSRWLSKEFQNLLISFKIKSVLDLHLFIDCENKIVTRTGMQTKRLYVFCFIYTLHLTIT